MRKFHTRKEKVSLQAPLSALLTDFNNFLPSEWRSRRKMSNSALQGVQAIVHFPEILRELFIELNFRFVHSRLRNAN